MVECASWCYCASIIVFHIQQAHTVCYVVCLHLDIKSLTLVNIYTYTCIYTCIYESRFETWLLLQSESLTSTTTQQNLTILHTMSGLDLS